MSWRYRRHIRLLLESPPWGFLIDQTKNRLRRTDAMKRNKERLQNGQYHTHFHSTYRKDDREFYKYMSMSQSTFDYILDRISPQLMKNWCNLHTRPILPEEKLVVTIKFLQTGLAYNRLGEIFCMGISTVQGIIKETSIAIWDTLVATHMPPLTKDILKNVATEFYEKWGFPHCCGAIDCKHCRIKNPPLAGSIYYNYKHFFSIVLQAVVDARGRFLSIDQGGYGQQSDGGTYQSSDLCRCLELGQIQMPDDDELPGTDIILSYFFIGDAAYPMSRNLLKAYPGEFHTDKSIANFNEIFNSIRRIVEHAFGRLASKWRMLFTTLEQYPEMVDHVMKCACLLHNIIIDLETPDGGIAPPQPAFANPEGPENVFGGSGIQTREDLRKYFDAHPRRHR